MDSLAKTMGIVNQSKLPTEIIAELEAAMSTQENLEDVMRWALSDPDGFLPQVVADVVVQDEFTALQPTAAEYLARVFSSRLYELP